MRQASMLFGVPIEDMVGAMLDNLSSLTVRRVTILAILIVILIVAVTALFNRQRTISDESSSLSLGEESKHSAPLKITFVEPILFNDMSREDVLSIRSNMINRYPELIAGSYFPSNFVFHAVKDNLPWHSIPGFYFWGQGKHTTEGLSKDSAIIMNPFLLVGIEFWGVSIWDSGNVKWNAPRISYELLNHKKFPYYPKPSELLWAPRERQVSVKYDLSSYIKRLSPLILKPISPPPYNIGLITYNARDFGLKYFYPQLKHSSGIKFKGLQDLPIINRDRIVSGAGCFNGSDCNHREFPAAPFDQFSIEKLPAKLVLSIWSERPAEVKVEPELTYSLTFE